MIRSTANWSLSTLVLIAVMVALTQSGCNAGTTNDLDDSNSEDQAALSGSDRLLIERLDTASLEDIGAFRREVLSERLSDDFIVPEHVVLAGSIRAARKVIDQRYPEFLRKEGDPLLKAIGENPVRYRQMIREMKSMARYYQGRVGIQNEQAAQ